MFTAGRTSFFASPLFETENGIDAEIISKGVDPSRTIAKIMVYVAHEEMLCALRLVDAEGKNVLNIEWGKLQHGEWIKQTIPVGKEIIGL